MGGRKGGLGLLPQDGEVRSLGSGPRPLSALPSCVPFRGAHASPVLIPGDGPRPRAASRLCPGRAVVVWRAAPSPFSPRASPSLRVPASPGGLPGCPAPFPPLPGLRGPSLPFPGLVTWNPHCPACIQTLSPSRPAALGRAGHQVGRRPQSLWKQIKTLECGAHPHPHPVGRGDEEGVGAQPPVEPAQGRAQHPGDSVPQGVRAQAAPLPLPTPAPPSG